MTLHVDIRKKLGDFQLEVAFDAGAEPLALLGASGCGKSVTLRCIAGILRPDEGRIALDGRSSSTAPPGSTSRPSSAGRATSSSSTPSSPI